MKELEQLKDSIPFLIRDDQDRILQWSGGCASLFGYSAEQALGRSSQDLLQTQWPEPPENIRAALKQTGRWQGELTHVRKDGASIVTASLWISDVSDPSFFVLEVYSDITKLKQSEKWLRFSEEKLRVATMATEVGVWAWKRGARPITVSDNWRRLFGIPRETEVTFRTWRNALHEEEKDSVVAELKAVHAGQPEFQTEYRVVHRDGTTRWVVDRGRAIYDSNGDVEEMAGISLDITNRKQAEEDLLRASRELERSNKDLESFAYVASHDLQEPLRTISGFVQLLEQRMGSQLDDKSKLYIQHAVDGSRRMHQMITDLLSYSRISRQPFAPKPVALKDVLEQVLALTRKSIEESGANVVIRELPAVRADASQMIRLFQNLIGNAIKFRSDRPLEIQVAAERQQRVWIFSVKDNGIGLDLKHHERIFQVFQRLHSRQKYPGNGIGLSICKKIIERHGGSIWVESTPDRGCTFFFTLPAD